MSIWNETVWVSKWFVFPSVQPASWCSRTSWGRSTARRTSYFGWPARTTRKQPARRKGPRLPKGSTWSLSKSTRPDRYGFCKAKVRTAQLSNPPQLLIVTITPPQFHSLIVPKYNLYPAFLWRSFVSSVLLFEHTVNFLRYDNVKKKNEKIKKSPNRKNSWVK